MIGRCVTGIVSRSNGERRFIRNGWRSWAGGCSNVGGDPEDGPRTQRIAGVSEYEYEWLSNPILLDRRKEVVNDKAEHKSADRSKMIDPALKARLVREVNERVLVGHIGLAN